MMLLQMPDHILTRIFSSLKVEDRLNLCLVSPKLNDLFSNEKALMKNILVHYELKPDEKHTIKYKRFMDSIIASCRKYRNLHIDFSNNRYQLNEVTVEDLLPLTKFKSLTELSIKRVVIELEDLALLINNLPNLKVFATNFLFYPTIAKKSTEVQLICKKLKKLDTHFSIFRMMETPVLMILKLQQLGYGENNLVEHRNKLVNLEKLKCVDVGQPIFNEEFAQNAKFKLKEITLDPRNWSDTVKFLKVQNELQKLTVEIIVLKNLGSVREIFESALMQLNLKSLALKIFIDFTDNKEFEVNISANTSIETFELQAGETWCSPTKYIENFIPKLPVLKNLSLNFNKWNGYCGDKFEILNTLKHLETLSISASNCGLLRLLNLPTLEDFSLTIPDLDLGCQNLDDNDLIKFFENHRNLKKLELPSLISKDVWKFIKNNLHNLCDFKNKFLEENHRCLSINTEKYDYFCSDEKFHVKVDADKGLVTATRIRLNC